MKTTRWGILGTGSIAKAFAKGLTALRDAELIAVRSRRQETADTFGDTFGVPNRYTSYEALAHAPEVDAIYVATPHTLHCENTLLCLNAGKPTLCEKPFAVTLAEAEAMVATARERGVFLMEAMWTRFFPLMTELRRLVYDGAIGEPHILATDFGFRAGLNPEGRLFNPQLGGGALLDVGVYCVSMGSMVFGEANRVVSMANIGETGVDEQSAFVLGHQNGGLSVLYTAIRTNTPQEAVLLGSEGSIRVHNRWWAPTTMTVQRRGRPPERLDFPHENNGYQFEASEVMRCLREGRRESEVMPLDESVTIIRTMAEIRAPWGLRYPGE
jgi:predicted dehydrogenase